MSQIKFHSLNFITLDCGFQTVGCAKGKNGGVFMA